MAILQYILLLVLTSLPLNSHADEVKLISTSDDFDIHSINKQFRLHGYVSFNAINFNHNKIYTPTTEFDVGVSSILDNNFELYGAVKYIEPTNGINKSLSVSSLYVANTISLNQYELRTQVGRMRNSFYMQNYARYTPVSRHQIVLPQAIYWNNLEDIVRPTEGLSFNITKHNSGIDLFYTINDFTIKDPLIVSEFLGVTGDLKGRKNYRYGASLDRRDYKIGVHHTYWGVLNKNDNELYCFDVDSAFIKIFNTTNAISYEFINGRTKSSGPSPSLRTFGDSITYLHYLNDDVRVYLNYNRFKYTFPEGTVVPNWKKSNNDFNFGVTYIPPSNPTLTFKLEHHIVKGAALVSSRYNKSDIKDNWNFTAAQVIYSF